MYYKLRQYQKDAVVQANRHFKSYNKPFVLVLPTGSGKSLVIADICHTEDEPTLILQPSKEILEQNFKKLTSYDISDIGIYSASFKSKQIAKYTYATIGSIYRKPELFMIFKRVIIDECHLVNPKNLGGMYNKFLKHIDCSKVCGLTASPYRVVQRYYEENDELYYTAQLQTINRIAPFFFKKFAYSITIFELLQQGYLCPLDYRFYDDFSVDSLKINSTGADYDAEDLEKFWTDNRLKKLSCIMHDIDLDCKHNLIFCSSINQAKRCADMSKTMNLSSDYISSEHNDKDRDRLIQNFKSGKIKHLCNVGVLTTGFDFPALDCITLARPTISLSLLYQMIGRGMRIDPSNLEKRCKVIDITGNIKKLGRIETIRLGKEDGYKDTVETEVGKISGKPLFNFKLKDSGKN